MEAPWMSILAYKPDIFQYFRVSGREVIEGEVADSGVAIAVFFLDAVGALEFAVHQRAVLDGDGFVHDDALDVARGVKMHVFGADHAADLAVYIDRVGDD